MDESKIRRHAPRQGFTEKQGQYLAFIYTYSHMFRRPPAETDMQRHFRRQPALGPSDDRHARTQRLHSPSTGRPRSIELLVAPENLPILKWLKINPSKSL